MKKRNDTRRAAVLRNPLLGKGHAHQQTQRQERRAVRRQLAERQWDDRSAAALRSSH